MLLQDRGIIEVERKVCVCVCVWGGGGGGYCGKLQKWTIRFKLKEWTGKWRSSFRNELGIGGSFRSEPESGDESF